MVRETLKICTVDFNWVKTSAEANARASMAHEFVDADPHAVVDWQLQLGANAIFQHAFTFNGCAWYPTRLGPEVPQARSGFFAKLLGRARDAGAAVGAYMNIGMDKFMCAARPEWLVPRTWEHHHPGFLAPESDWTDLLCRRVEEFLRDYPVDVMLFDWFVYGTTVDRIYPVQPAPFVRGPFREIIGREMPEEAEGITEKESLEYQREVLARQFYRIRDAVKGTHADCQIMINVPFWKGGDPKWVDHPMVKESDWLFAECSQTSVLDWLFAVKRPEQRVFTTIISGIDDRMAHADLSRERWKALHARGCDLVGWAFPDPATGWPGPWYDDDLSFIREVFHSV